MDIQQLPEEHRERILDVLVGMNGAFWHIPRKMQVIALLRAARGRNVSQKLIAIAMGVAESYVTKYKQRFQERPDNMFPRPGRPSPIGDVFEDIKEFIEGEVEADRSVTLGVLMEFLVDELNLTVTRHAVWEYMTSHGYSYVSGIPTEAERVTVERGELQRFYERELPNALQGAHPALVFNMDEMGAERYADRKRINVFVPNEEAPEDGGVLGGIPRTSNRCTLMACIGLDGSRLKPLIITRNKTVSSLMFENGYSRENLILVSTKKAT